MHREFLMGNEAIALGALAAGVSVAAGYPGTPSTEVLETVAARRGSEVYVEWSVNEKAAMELAAGAAYAGAAALVTMKQVGLNVASDPLMSLAYVGVEGGMVVMVADDPGPISSQTEQDTRQFAVFSRLPCFDPASVQEAYEMIQDAFRLSAEYKTPVLFRPTTRICHAYASVTVKDEAEYAVRKAGGFVKDSNRWVIFPKLSYQNHRKIEARNALLSERFSAYDRNRILPAAEPGCRRGIAAQGISFACLQEALEGKPAPRLFQVATTFPFPEQAAVRFLKGLDEVLVLEELSPLIERELTYVCGKYGLSVRIRGKLTGDADAAGENSRDSVEAAAAAFLGWEPAQAPARGEAPALPVRPPVLCAGCPHRASFLAVKEAMAGHKCIFCGDIGCYTLGNAQPLDMVDTCLCMGAGVNIAQGVGRVEPDTTCFAFVGDSTFFASAMTGAANAVYNGADMILVVLDNSTTAMTGHQPHPGTGKRLSGEVAEKISIEAVLKGIGVGTVETVDPFDFAETKACVSRLADMRGVRALILRAPCIAVTKPKSALTIDPKTCIGCRKCIREVGCPAISLAGDRPVIDPAQCTGCGLCAVHCPVSAIGGGKTNE